MTWLSALFSMPFFSLPFFLYQLPITMLFTDSWFITSFSSLIFHSPRSSDFIFWNWPAESLLISSWVMGGCPVLSQDALLQLFLLIIPSGGEMADRMDGVGAGDRGKQNRKSVTWAEGAACLYVLNSIHACMSSSYKHFLKFDLCCGRSKIPGRNIHPDESPIERWRQGET